jgi:hypothetical protein
MGKEVKAKRSSSSASPPGYYYADGERVELTPADDLVAIDDQRFARADLPERVRALVEKAARPLTSGIRLVDRSMLEHDAAALAALQKAGVVQPAYRSQGAVVVVLPEVRVEEGRGGATKRRLKQWLHRHAADADVDNEGDERITIRPKSGSGQDALALANSLAEEVRPELAQARFVRSVKGPAIMTRR